VVQLQYRSEISFTESFRVAMPWTSVQSGERCERWGKSGGKGPTNNGLWRLMDTQGRYIYVCVGKGGRLAGDLLIYISRSPSDVARKKEAAQQATGTGNK
jgi:hypothetical protein